MTDSQFTAQKTDFRTRLVVVDLDGTLFDDEHRRHLLPSLGMQDSDYESYHSRLDQDGVIGPTRKWLENLECEARKEKGSKTAVMFLTARPEKYRAKTVSMLRNNFQSEPSALWNWTAAGLTGKSFFAHLQMREEGNRLSSPQFKAQKLKILISDMHFDELVVLDDRMDVLMALEAETTHIKKRSFIQVVRTEETCDNNDEWLHALIHATGLAEARQKQGCCSALPKENANPFVIPGTSELSVPEILRKAADTAEERNDVYKDNYKMVGPIMGTLFPDGIPPHILTHPAFHLLELIVVKLTRFAISELSHEDSIHDIMVYAGIIDKIVLNRETGQEK